MTEDYYLTYEYENRLKKVRVFHYQPVGALGISSLNVGALYSVPSYIKEWNFTYDANGIRIKKVYTYQYGITGTPYSTTTIYHYDEQGNVIQETDEDGNIKATYVYANGQRVAKIKPDGTIIFYINDPLGSPLLILMDEDGNIVKRYRFDPWGNIEAQWGTEPNHYLFTGKEKDRSGFYYFGARYYNPRLGRWITPEPLFNDPARLGDLKLEEPQSLNPYTYCVNNPFLYLDPTGEVYVKQAIFASLQIAGGAAGGVLSAVAISAAAPIAIPSMMFSVEQVWSGVDKLIAAIKEQPEPPSRIERLGEIIGGEKGRMIAGIIEAIGGAISPNPGGKVKMTLSVLSEVKSLKSIKLYKKIAGALGLVNESIVNIRRIEGGYEILTDRGRKIFVFEEEYWGYPPELFYLHNVH